MYPRKCVNHVSNCLVEKILDDFGSIFFPLDIITRESIEIFMWELNKVYDMSVQYVGNKESKMEWFIINWNLSQKVALYTLVHLVHFNCTVSVIPLYNDTNFISL